MYQLLKRAQGDSSNPNYKIISQGLLFRAAHAG
jgi:hypothetical protein